MCDKEVNKGSTPDTAPCPLTTMIGDYATSGSVDSDMIDHQTQLLSEIYNDIRTEHENDAIQPFMDTTRFVIGESVCDMDSHGDISPAFGILLPPSPPLRPKT